MTGKTTNTILILMLAGIALGGVLGYYFPSAMLSTAVIGKLFLSALQLIVAPLIISGIIAGVGSLADIRRVGRPLLTILMYFVSTTAVAVGIGLALTSLILPGTGIGTVGAHLTNEIARAASTGLSDMFLSLIPTSLPQAIIEGQYLGIIVFSLFFGGLLATLGAGGRVVVGFFKTVKEVILKLVNLILYAAPIGLFSVVGTIVAKNSSSLGELSGRLSYYLVVLGAGLLLQAVVVLPLILKFYGHRAPLRYFSNMAPAISTALATGSSAVAFPVAYTGVVEKNKVDSRAGSLTLSLGMAMNLNGTALYAVTAALFIAQAYGVSLSVVQILSMAAVGILVSLGAASIPYAGIFLLVFVLRAGGFPSEAYAGIGLIIGVDWLFDRFRAAVNVWGDSVGAAVVARTFQPDAASKERATRARPQKTAPRERRRREPVGGTRRSGTRQERPQRPRRDERTSRSTKDQRHKVRNLTASAGKSRSRLDRQAVQPTLDRSEHQRSERKRESRRTDLPKSETVRMKKETLPSSRTPETKQTTPNESRFGDAARLQKSSEKETPLVEVPSPEYGRLKSRRGKGVVRNEQDQVSHEESDTAGGQEEFPIENVSFGRQKKKRQR